MGSIETLRSNFRLVAATHKSLQQMVADGRFRQDLYYRISAFPIHLPPLSMRAADIPMLVESFPQRSGHGKQRIAVEPEAMAKLQSYDWTGNIRELRNVMDRARPHADDGIVHAEHLPEPLNPATLSGPVADTTTAYVASGKAVADDALKRLALSFHGTRRELAAQAGLSERTLYRRLKDLGLA